VSSTLERAALQADLRAHLLEQVPRLEALSAQETVDRIVGKRLAGDLGQAHAAPVLGLGEQKGRVVLQGAGGRRWFVERAHGQKDNKLPTV
jgi:hypothetical protein